MSSAGVYPGRKRAWKCDWCGLVQTWGPTWVWYGSYIDMDTLGVNVPTFCCEPHGHQWEANGRRNAEGKAAP